MNLGHFGSAHSAVVSETETVLSGAGGSPASITQRIKEVRHTLEQANPRMKQVHSQRLVALQGGEVVIGIGGRTDVERN